MFTFIIPTNKPKYLKETIDSLLSINYARDFFEVLVVENPEKTEKVSSIMSGLPDNFKHLVCKTIGANTARNLGVKNAKYDIIILTDDDCLVSQDYLIHVFNTFKKSKYEMVGGPLVLKFIIDRPKWLTKHFAERLSEVNWSPQIKICSDLSVLKGSYLVSANLVFTKNLFSKIGPLEENNCSTNGLFANDENRFIERAKKHGILYNPNLLIEHLIGPERCSIEYFIQRMYIQGYSDAVIELEVDNPIDVYHNCLQQRMVSCYSYNEANSIRNEIKNEDITRQWIRYKILMESAYNIGFIHKLEGKKKCDNICALLMNATEQNIYIR